MRVMFVYYVMDDAGSAQDIRNYARVARELGHEIVVYGSPRPESPFEFSRDVDGVDALVFIFEWTTELRDGDQLDLARLMGRIPRERRMVIDCDGAYNERLCVDGDYNHRDAAASRAWRDVCESIADKICQPTLTPAQEHVRTFFFHAYDPNWEVDLDFRAKEFGMVYVGHSKFRWGPMERVLRAVEPIRDRVGRMALVGHGWDELPAWATPMRIEDFYYTDRDYLDRLGVEIAAPVPFNDVIPWMSRAVFNPVVYRPLFERLGFVTCRTFETPAASTIPLFALDRDYVRAIYGPAADELVLSDDRPEDQLLDIVSRPGHYEDLVSEIRRRLAAEHSYARRIDQLVEIVES
jgi:Glycosyl transferases group 1